MFDIEAALRHEGGGTGAAATWLSFAIAAMLIDIGTL